MIQIPCCTTHSRNRRICYERKRRSKIRSSHFFWSSRFVTVRLVLEDKAFGTLLNAETGLPCSEVGNGFLCSALHSVIFQSSTHKGKVLIRLSETDHDIDEVPLTIYVLPPAIRDIVLTDEEEEPLQALFACLFQNQFSFLRKKDEKTEASKQESPENSCGSQYRWSKMEHIRKLGSIVGGVFNAREKVPILFALKNTIHRIPGINDITQSTETVVSESIAISVGDAALYIDSLHLTGKRRTRTRNE